MNQKLDKLFKGKHNVIKVSLSNSAINRNIVSISAQPQRALCHCVVMTKRGQRWWWCLRLRRPRPAELAGSQRVVADASVSRLRDCRCVWAVFACQSPTALTRVVAARVCNRSCADFTVYPIILLCVNAFNLLRCSRRFFRSNFCNNSVRRDEPVVVPGVRRGWPFSVRVLSSRSVLTVHCYHTIHTYRTYERQLLALVLGTRRTQCYDVVRFAATGGRRTAVSVVHDFVRRRTTVVGAWQRQWPARAGGGQWWPVDVQTERQQQQASQSVAERRPKE